MIATYYVYRGIYRAAWSLFYRLVTRMIALNTKWNSTRGSYPFLTGEQLTTWVDLQALAASKLLEKVPGRFP